MAKVMQKPGDICEVCAEREERQSNPKLKMKPQVLQSVGYTQFKKIPLVACERCDGEVVKRYRAKHK